MIFKQKKDITRFGLVEKCKQEIIDKAGGEAATVESVMDVLFGTRYHEYEDNQYFVCGYDEEESSVKWWQRLNSLWVVPCVLVLVFPVQWIVKGERGVKENTKFGRFIIKLIGSE